MTTARLLDRCQRTVCDPATRHRTGSVALGLLALLLSLLAPARADDSEALQQLEKKLDRRGTIMLRDASLAEWLFAIQEVWKVDIVFGNDLQNVTVNGAFEDRTLREVLNTILIAQEYGYEPVGSSLIIKPLDQMGKLKPQFKDELFTLQYIEPGDAEPTVSLLLSPHGTVQSIPSSKSLYIIDLPERIEKIRQHLAQLEEHARLSIEQQRALRQQEEEERRALQRQAREDEPQVGQSEPTLQLERAIVKVFRPQHVKVTEELTDVLQSVVGAEGTVNFMIEENRLIVIAPPSLIHTAEQVLRQIDRPRAQVRITALLYDVNVEEMERFGFNWTHAGKGRINAAGDPQSLYELNNNNFALPGAGGGGDGGDGGDGGGAGDAMGTAISTALGGWVTLSHLSRHFDLTAIIQALSTINGARLLARPNILATDGAQAEFSAVSEIPVQSLTETAEGGSIGTTEFREAGIKLTVTPEIKDDGTLQLRITPEFSVLAGFQEGQPIIDRRSATTTLQMHNGQTVVIGGLLRRNEFENQRALPGARKWKYFSGFFRDHETTVAESELLVIVRAEIIGPEPLWLPREEAVRSAVEHSLELVPYATHGPFVPSCGDPYCPLHNPRTCLDCPPHSAGGLPPKCVHAESFETIQPSPHIQLPLPPPPPALEGAAPGEALGPEQEPLPESRTHEARLRYGGPPSLPPVLIDETARLPRPAAERLAIRRLPQVTDPASATAEPPLTARRLPDPRSQPARETSEPAPPPELHAETDVAPEGQAETDAPPELEAESDPQPDSQDDPPVRSAARKNWLKSIFQY